ncbi:hypothetical protein KIN20_016583 [Parelaphostrongylus tenuis]|uniref:Uncharacterized protein n=1 Tax=Parelaphostrongylus tenuis TaxID=148309 RepID=A0AAD5MLU2_PARTN|nr:hypothetical protein KIN20_016576 [Parelaphostrongylus tenuis]KAJ1358220.1 hypothetical protein KIN20_016583 [Parelaphostrongylus tenuis]
MVPSWTCPICATTDPGVEYEQPQAELLIELVVAMMSQCEYFFRLVRLRPLDVRFPGD